MFNTTALTPRQGCTRSAADSQRSGTVLGPDCLTYKHNQPREHRSKPVFAGLFVALKLTSQSYATGITLYAPFSAWI